MYINDDYRDSKNLKKVTEEGEDEFDIFTKISDYFAFKNITSKSPVFESLYLGDIISAESK